MTVATTCICLQAACEEGLVQEATLLKLAAAAELKVRKVASGPADLLFSKAGNTLAFLLWRSGGRNASSAADTDMAARVARLMGTFKRSYVLVPHQLLGDRAMANAVATLGGIDGPSFVYMPAGANFTERAVSLARALLAAEAQRDAWRQQQLDVAATGEAVSQVLQALPLPPDGDAAHHANMLRMLGSLQHISDKSAEELAQHTDIDHRTSAAIAAFFQRGGHRHQQQQGVFPAEAHMQPL